MNKLLFNLRVSKIIYAVIVLCNVVLPWQKGVILKVNLFTILIVAFWTYGLMSHLGHFLQPVTAEEDGKTEYEVNIPIVQIGITRLVQVMYLFFLKRDVVDWRIIALLIGMDAIYVAFIMMDKASYYYESEELPDESE